MDHITEEIKESPVTIDPVPSISHHPTNSGSLIIGFITIVFCIGLGFILGKNTTVRPITEPIQAIATPAPDPFANWITFSNTLFPFEFKYPKELSSFIRLTEKGIIMDSPDGGDMPLVKIDRYETPFAPTPWWYTYGLSNYPWMYNVATNLYNLDTNESIKGTEAVGQRKNIKGFVVSESLILLPYQNSLYVLYMNHNANPSIISSSKQILSSFQFISVDPKTASSVNVVDSLPQEP